jgi:hypothetical protein
MVSPRVRRGALLAVALLLVCNPFYLDGLLHVDDPNRYEYHAEKVRFHADGHPNVSADVPALADDEEVGCLLADDRACAFERYVLRNGPVTVRSAPGWTYDGSDEYVFLNGSFYRPQAEPVGDDPPRERLSLEPASRETALEAAASPFHEASSGARTAITDGPVTRRRALPDARTLVAHDGEYYVVYAKYGRWVNDESFAEQRGFGNALEGAVSALGVLLGLRLFASWVSQDE